MLLSARGMEKGGLGTGGGGETSRLLRKGEGGEGLGLQRVVFLLLEDAHPVRTFFCTGELTDRMAS